MSNDSLHDLVTKLHAELSDALRADPKSRESLSEMMRDINRLIDNPADAAAPPPGTVGAAGTAAGSLPDRLERVAVQFEAAHPTLAASARRLVDLLGEVGI
jgi:Domain of unknown function (DUF4404)